MIATANIWEWRVQCGLGRWTARFVLMAGTRHCLEQVVEHRYVLVNSGLRWLKKAALFGHLPMTVAGAGEIGKFTALIGADFGRSEGRFAIAELIFDNQIFVVESSLLEFA